MRKHITVSIDESVYRQARAWVARRDASVSSLVQYLLENLPGLPIAREFHAHVPPCPPHHLPTKEEIAPFLVPHPRKKTGARAVKLSNKSEVEHCK